MLLLFENLSYLAWEELSQQLNKRS